MHYYNDGADGFVWEPLYRKRSGLTPCEQEIVMHPALRRLQRIAHYGGSARILPMTHTRFTHTIGVFTLAVHFCPEDWLLRLAALLHDVGHLPFSHSAERGLGADHHELTVRVLEESGLNAILRKHGFDPAAVLAVIEGRPPNPLVCGADRLSLDHLDSWLRDTETCAMGQIPAHQLLDGLRLNGPYVEAIDERTAREVVRRVAADHRLFLKPRCLAMDTLVTEIFAQAHPAVDPLLKMGDEEALTLAAERVPHLVELLRDRPWAVEIRPDDGGPGLLVTVRKLYTGQILLNGRPVAEAMPEAAAVYEALERLKQSYRVTLRV
ncbi:MAG: HD domain-containing protein [Bacillota bacterium]